MRGNLLIVLAAATLGALTMALYGPGLSGPFVFDDEPNITLNLRLAIDSLDPESLWRAALSGNSGPFLRPLSMVSFALNYYAAGPDPFSFKLVNVVIHLANAIGLGVLGYLLISAVPDASVSRRARAWMALAVVAAWTLHPLNLTSVLFVVQRMTSLATFWMVWAMTFYVWGRLRQRKGESGWWPILTGLVIFGPLAFLSKETGALLPIYLLVIEWCLFRFVAPEPRTRRLLQLLFVVIVVAPMAATALVLTAAPAHLTGDYSVRNFTLDERLLTEGRVLLWYLRQILLPDITQMGLLLDDIPISRSLANPGTTWPALLLVAALLGLALRFRTRWPMLAFGTLWFFGGHALESTFPALEIAYEHRNYLPAYGVLLAASWHTLHPQRPRLRLRIALASAWLVLVAAGLQIRAGHWSSEVRWALTEVAYHPDSARSQYLAGAQYQALAISDSDQREHYFELARLHFERALAINPRLANIWLATIVLYQRSNRPFPADLLDRTAYALRTSPFEASHLNAIANLTNCLADRICSLTETEYHGLITAALDNPTLRGRSRANVLLYASSYLATVKTDYRAALQLIDRAIAIAPDWIPYRMTRLKWLLLAGDFESGRKEMDVVVRLDRLKQFNRDIREIEAALPQLRRAGGIGKD